MAAVVKAFVNIAVYVYVYVYVYMSNAVVCLLYIPVVIQVVSERESRRPLVSCRS